MPDVIDGSIQENEFGDVLLDELEVGVSAEMGNIIHGTGYKVIDANHLVTTGEEQVSKVRTKKAGGAGDDGC